MYGDLDTSLVDEEGLRAPQMSETGVALSFPIFAHIGIIFRRLRRLPAIRIQLDAASRKERVLSEHLVVLE